MSANLFGKFVFDCGISLSTSGSNEKLVKLLAGWSFIVWIFNLVIYVLSFEIFATFISSKTNLLKFSKNLTLIGIWFPSNLLFA